MFPSRDLLKILLPRILTSPSPPPLLSLATSSSISSLIPSLHTSISTLLQAITESLPQQALSPELLESLSQFSLTFQEYFLECLSITFAPKLLFKRLLLAVCFQVTVFTIQQFESIFRYCFRLCYSKVCLLSSPSPPSPPPLMTLPHDLTTREDKSWLLKKKSKMSKLTKHGKRLQRNWMSFKVTLPQPLSHLLSHSFSSSLCLSLTLSLSLSVSLSVSLSLSLSLSVSLSLRL
jgi:hypothetical protein